MARQRSFSDKFWYDKNGKFVVWQKPNFLLWIWIIAVVISVLMTNNALERSISYIGEIAIFIWAIRELGWGVNYFYRTLGLCVILLIIVSRVL